MSGNNGCPNDENDYEVYVRVMRPMDLDLPDGAKFTLRVYDGMDHCWCDCLDATKVSLDVALSKWMKETDSGTKRVAFSEIDYYRIFPADTRMIYDSDSAGERGR
jgi:hypothetical protein